MAGPWEKYRQQQPVPIGPRDPRVDASAGASNANAAATMAGIEDSRRRTAVAEEQLRLDKEKLGDARQKAAIARQKDMEARKTRAMELVENIYRTDRLIRDIDNGAKFEAGALGSFLSNIPGTAAYDFAADLDPLRSSIARGSLGQMRQESPTGGAVGQLNEGERVMFESSRGSLKQGQSPGNLRRSLMDVRNKTLMELERLAPNVGKRIRTQGTLYERKSRGSSPPRKQSGGEFLGWED